MRCEQLLRLFSVLLWYLAPVSAIFGRQTCNDDPTCFWSDYPPCSEKCHEDLWPSTTCYASGQLNDDCLCPDVAWLTANAQCIGQNCYSELQEAASICNAGCSSYGLQMGISEQEFVSIGQQAASSSATSSSSATPATSPTTAASVASSQTINTFATNPTETSSPATFLTSGTSSNPTSATSAPTSSPQASSGGGGGGGGVDPSTRLTIILSTVIPSCALIVACVGVWAQWAQVKAAWAQATHSKPSAIKTVA